MKPLRSIVSLAFAALVLLSSSSFMVGVHYCQGEMESLSIFGKADCSKVRELPPCHRHMASHCCEDKVVVHDGQDFKNSTTQVNLVAPFVAEVACPALLLSDLSEFNIQSNYSEYHPPFRTCDRTVSLQVFLI